MATKGAASGIPRTIEVVMAGVGLILTAPLLAAASLLIKVSSPGPVLFRQKRVGRDCEEFTLLKLRTMTIADKGPLITAANDSRITAVGKILRKTKIDELPGLWNVIRGDMSFVGPRPEVCEFVNANDPQWQEVLKARPGITDPVTLRLRNEEKLLAGIEDKESFYREVLQPYKLNGYIDFLRTRSFKNDISVIAGTLKAIAHPRGSTLPTFEEMRSARRVSHDPARPLPVP